MYVLFEGIDTVGKSTQIQKLKEIYPDAVITQEPGATQLGKELRAILLEKELHISTEAEAFLFLADRAEHYAKVIAPNNDRFVISDRGFISGIAYALTNNPANDLDFLISLNRFALSGKMPDKVVFIKTNQNLLHSRIAVKTHDNIEQRGAEYLLKVQENMEKTVKKVGIDCIILNADESIEALFCKIKRFLDD
ncbi:MAG: dTMP kinase [Campylobacteraceae bacterium]|jgi:dTMP kinase|nr:dTMP kinase [Campylobacteraceae bacterium]